MSVALPLWYARWLHGLRGGIVVGEVSEGFGPFADLEVVQVVNDGVEPSAYQHPASRYTNGARCRNSKPARLHAHFSFSRRAATSGMFGYRME